MIANKISMNQINFDDFAKKILAQRETKTASAEPVVKTASVKEEVKTVKVSKVTKVAKKEDKQETTDAGGVEGKLVNKPEVCPCKDKKSKTEKSDAQQTTDAGKVEGKLVNEPKKEASSVKFVKVAKLNAKTKAFLKTYWGNLYPAEYVESMLAD